MGAKQTVTCPVADAGAQIDDFLGVISDGRSEQVAFVEVVEKHFVLDPFSDLFIIVVGQAIAAL